MRLQNLEDGEHLDVLHKASEVIEIREPFLMSGVFTIMPSPVPPPPPIPYIRIKNRDFLTKESGKLNMVLLFH